VRIAVIPGDGIGQEVVPEGRRVLDRVASGHLEYEHFPWGCQYYLETGQMIDPDGLDRLRDFDAIYFGAVGWPGVRTTSACGVCAWQSARASINTPTSVRYGCCQAFRAR
jgi:isocitrate/isopropylmalate dehydrogenase